MARWFPAVVSEISRWCQNREPLVSCAYKCWCVGYVIRRRFGRKHAFRSSFCCLPSLQSCFPMGGGICGPAIKASRIRPAQSAGRCCICLWLAWNTSAGYEPGAHRYGPQPQPSWSALRIRSCRHSITGRGSTNQSQRPRLFSSHR